MKSKKALFIMLGVLVLFVLMVSQCSCEPTDPSHTKVPKPLDTTVSPGR